MLICPRAVIPDCREAKEGDMPRAYVRCRAELPVRITAPDSDTSLDAKTANLGLGGAFLNPLTGFPESDLVKLRANLPNFGEFEIPSEIIRAGENGIAVRFLKLQSELRSNLWEFIKQYIEEKAPCPYCGQTESLEREKCTKCGFSVNFRASDYLERHKRDLISNRMNDLDRGTREMSERVFEIEDSFYNLKENPAITSQRIRRTLSRVLDLCAELERVADGEKELIRRKRTEFRERTAHLSARSELLNYCRNWPRGHQGDYRMLQYLYRNRPVSDGIGALYDEYVLSRPLSSAVRGRAAFMKTMLQAELKSRPGAAILDINCGPCQEILELGDDIKEARAKVTCVDNDEGALEFARERLSYAGLLKQVSLRKYNPLKMADHAANMKEFGPQDVIYSMGLFDYLRDNTFIGMLNSFFRMLKPKGKLIVPLKDSFRYKTQDYHWLADWDSFLQRTAEEGRGLLEKTDIPSSRIQTVRERSGIIVFHIISKGN